MKRVLRFLLPLLVLAVGAGLFLQFRSDKVESAPIKAVVRPPVVAVQVVEKQALSPQLTLFGRIEAPSNSVLSAGIAADVISVSVLEGSAVQAGEVLLQLDEADVALEILQRKAELAEIEAQLESERRKQVADKSALEREQALLGLSRKAVERARTLARTSAGTEATLDSALQQEQQQLLAITQRRQSIDDFSSRQKLWQARRAKAQAVLDRSDRDLSRTVIRAPYSGRIISVMVSPGDRTTPGTPLIKLYDSQRLEVRAQVPSRYIDQLQAALNNELAISAVIPGSQPVNLSLSRLSASVSQGQGGVDAFFRAPPGALPALGTTIELQLELPALPDVVMLPPDAMYGDNRVYRVTDGKLESVTVTRLGLRRDTSRQQLLLDGGSFANGDQILSSRLPQAIAGLVVEPRND